MLFAVHPGPLCIRERTAVLNADPRLVGFEVIGIDGVRILFGDGWGLVRASNTQPVLVLRFEAKTEERLQEIKKLVIDKLKEFGEIKI